MDACKVVDRGSVISGHASADVEVSRAVLDGNEGKDTANDGGSPKLTNHRPIAIEAVEGLLAWRNEYITGSIECRRNCIRDREGDGRLITRIGCARVVHTKRSARRRDNSAANIQILRTVADWCQSVEFDSREICHVRHVGHKGRVEAGVWI